MAMGKKNDSILLVRLTGDYGESGVITQEQAEQQIERTQEFLKLEQLI
jgi:hypothetical protein